MKKQLLILATLFISVIGYSQSVGDTFIDTYVTYEVTSILPNEVKIINYNISGGSDVIIPATVTPSASGRASSPMETYNVTSIGTSAFYSKGITSVEIPNSIISIGTQAFAVNYISSAIIGDSVTNIGFSAFYNNNLTSVIIPDSVTIIDSRAFDDNLLTNIIIPINVTTIGFAAFRDNPITCVVSYPIVPPTITTESSINDTFIANRSGMSLTIPMGTGSAYTSAAWTGFGTTTESDFGNTWVIDNITYQVNASANNEVTVIDYNTTGGPVVNIPATVVHACTTYSVTEIGYLAFNSNGLNDVTLSDAVVTIGDSAFSNNNLTNITIPNSVTSIEKDAFNNNQLTVVNLSDNLIYIGESSFAFNDLTSLTIPNSVITIDDGAFAQSNNLTSLTLGDNVSVIGDFAFRFTGLTNVTLPASVTDIGVVAFGGFSVITDVYCEGSVPPTISTNSASNSDTFNDFRGNIHLHIPTGTMGVYVTNPGALWTGFNPVTEDAALSTTDFDINNSIHIIATSETIKVMSSDSVRLEHYTIYSMSGAKISTGIENEIMTASFSKGIYILELDFDKGTTTKKVVIN